MPISNLLIATFMVAVSCCSSCRRWSRMFLRNVDAGTIRIVTWWGGNTHIYRGPGKSYRGAAADQRHDALQQGHQRRPRHHRPDRGPRRPTARRSPSRCACWPAPSFPSATRTSSPRPPPTGIFAKPEDEQLSTLTDLLSSSGRRAVNLLTHDQLFSAKSAPRPGAVAAPSPSRLPRPGPVLIDDELAVQAAEDDDDPLAIIIRKACSRELTDLGLIFNSLNIKVVQSRGRRSAPPPMSAAEATANADIVAAQQAYRAQQAKIAVERSAFPTANRELEQTRASNAALVAEADIKQTAGAGNRRNQTPRGRRRSESERGHHQRATNPPRQGSATRSRAHHFRSPARVGANPSRNAALIAEAEAKKQEALAIQREAELRATQTAQATADAERVRIDAQAKAQPRPSASRRSARRTPEASARSTRRSRRAAKVICVIGRWRCCRRSPRRLPTRWRRPSW